MKPTQSIQQIYNRIKTVQRMNDMQQDELDVLFNPKYMRLVYSHQFYFNKN
jgi:hypothetical protein